MGSTSATVAKGGKGKKGKKLTVADVNVLVVGRPEAQSVLACASPDVFAAPAPFLSPSSALSPATPGAQWASYPASPSPYALGHAHSASTPSPALYAAYTTQRSPRRRASTASNATGWSYSSSSNSGHSGSGQSDAGSDASAGSGLRRKPIPVEMFLR
ncbi:hypothetical protein FB451DRAFT_1231710 [Mycena latifolia]|nr:hypothetical protein FB451DRAFT_1231710 [Mycena latifolia]